MRVLALLNLFAKEKGFTDLNLSDDKLADDLKILQTLARICHQEMIQELKKTTNNDHGYYPSWPSIPSAIRLKYALVLERKALHMDMPLYRCKDSWCADRLLYEVHKNRGLKKNNRTSDITKTLIA